MTTLRGGPFDGAVAPELGYLEQFVMGADGSLTIPRAITIETDDGAYRYELQDEECLFQFGPGKDDVEVDMKYYYQFVGKDG